MIDAKCDWASILGAQFCPIAENFSKSGAIPVFHLKSFLIQESPPNLPSSGAEHVD
jgi:hypothetical protein